MFFSTEIIGKIIVLPFQVRGNNAVTERSLESGLLYSLIHIIIFSYIIEENAIHIYNQKHPTIKFNYKCDCKYVQFLDTLVYIDQQNKLQTTLFRKSIEGQNFLNAKSEHPYSLN